MPNSTSRKYGLPAVRDVCRVITLNTVACKLNISSPLTAEIKFGEAPGKRDCA
jgi:hypothetical protein